jgi:hypothetical protein
MAPSKLPPPALFRHLDPPPIKSMTRRLHNPLFPLHTRSDSFECR